MSLQLLISPTEFGRILNDGMYWMNLFAGKQMPVMLKSPLAIRQMLLIQIQTYFNQLLSQITRKHCLLDYLNWKRVSDIYVLYIDSADGCIGIMLTIPNQNILTFS